MDHRIWCGCISRSSCLSQLTAMCGEIAHECVRATISMFMRFHCELKCVFVHTLVCAGKCSRAKTIFLKIGDIYTYISFFAVLYH